MHGPSQPDSVRVMQNNHRLKGEDFRAGVNRISGALSDSDDHFRQLQSICGENRFLFGGRIQAAAGAPKTTTMHNCFVGGTIKDSMIAGSNSIMDCLTQAAATMRLGGGIGNDFSTLRPQGSMIKKLLSSSSGPLPFMKMFNAMGLTVASAGDRRGAQMGVLRVDHPDIMSFIRMKQNQSDMTGFNISVGVTDEFMDAVRNSQPFALRFEGQVYDTVSARDLWQAIMQCAWDFSEPGVIFLDRINQQNNLWYCETIAATNPCGEQPLPPYGACLLGSFNLTRYVRPKTAASASSPRWSLDLEQLAKDVAPVVRAMDNVNDISNYALPEQREEALSKRRMGIGVTGMANAIEACGHPYGSDGFIQMQEEILRTITLCAYRASVELAKEKGPFPLFDAEKYGSQGFASGLPDDLLSDIRAHGIRNSHLTSIAPTGSISYGLGDNCSSSIEPVFALEQERDIIGPEGKRTVVISDYGLREFGVRGKTTSEVTLEEHLRVLATAQMWTDSAVSKTINIREDRNSWADFCRVYEDAHALGAKGCTAHVTHLEGGRESVLRSLDGATCTVDPVTGATACE